MPYLIVPAKSVAYILDDWQPGWCIYACISLAIYTPIIMQLHAHTHTDEAKHQSFIKRCQIPSLSGWSQSQQLRSIKPHSHKSNKE